MAQKSKRTQFEHALRAWWLQVKIDYPAWVWSPTQKTSGKHIGSLVQATAKFFSEHASLWQAALKENRRELRMSRIDACNLVALWLANLRASLTENISAALRYVAATGYISAAAWDHSIAPFDDAALDEAGVKAEKHFKDHLKSLQCLGLARWTNLLQEHTSALLERVTRLEESNRAAVGTEFPIVPLPFVEFVGSPPTLSGASRPAPSGLWWSENPEGTPPAWLGRSGGRRKGVANAKYVAEVFLFVARQVWSRHLVTLPDKASLVVADEKCSPWSAAPVLDYLLNQRSSTDKRSAASWAELVLSTSSGRSESNGDVKFVTLTSCIQILQRAANSPEQPNTNAATSRVASRVLATLLDRNSGIAHRPGDANELFLLLSQTGKQYYVEPFDGVGPRQLERRFVGILYDLGLAGRARQIHKPTITKLYVAVPKLQQIIGVSRPSKSERVVGLQGLYTENESDAVLNVGCSLVVDVVPGTKLP